MTIFYRNILELKSAFRNNSITAFFNLPDKNLNFNIEYHNDHYNLLIFYNKQGVYFEFPQLPSELNAYIWKFNVIKINIKFKINSGGNYPFLPPIWELIDLNHNINSYIDLHDYYRYIVDTHNNKNNIINSWSPANRLIKDLLEFIMRINHFDYLVLS